MAGGKLGSGGDEPLVDINMVPFIDIVLVVMIIFMVSTKLIQDQAIKVNLPEAATGELTETTSLGITVTRDGGLYLDGTPTTEAGLRERVKTEKAKGAEVICLISGDQEARHGDVTHVIDVIRQEGVSKFAIDIEPKPAPPPN